MRPATKPDIHHKAARAHSYFRSGFILPTETSVGKRSSVSPSSISRFSSLLSACKNILDDLNIFRGQDVLIVSCPKPSCSDEEEERTNYMHNRDLEAKNGP